jgi:hypothetical protein
VEWAYSHKIAPLKLVKLSFLGIFAFCYAKKKKRSDLGKDRVLASWVLVTQLACQETSEAAFFGHHHKVHQERRNDDVRPDGWAAAGHKWCRKWLQIHAELIAYAMHSVLSALWLRTLYNIFLIRPRVLVLIVHFY